MGRLIGVGIGEGPSKRVLCPECHEHEAVIEEIRRGDAFDYLPPCAKCGDLLFRKDEAKRRDEIQDRFNELSREADEQ